MDYSTAVQETWQHRDLSNAAHDYRPLVHYATLAASSHNTQPWKFRLEQGSITILPDLSRRCPAVDPDDHHLYASLGCAAENLLLAAQAAGLEAHCSFNASESGVRVEFREGNKDGTPIGSALFEAISTRQCSRVAYDETPLPDDQLRLLEDAGSGNGVSVMLLTDKDQKQQIAEYVAAGNTAQFADSAWGAELKSWIRFNSREAVRTGDGLYGPVMGSPDVPRWLGSLFMRFGFSPTRQNRKDRRYIQSSSVIAVFYSELDDKAHWVEAGRCYQRLALQAAALNLRTAFINQPVEVPALRSRLATFLGIDGRRPDLILRIGHGPESPRSLRRPVEEVIV